MRLKSVRSENSVRQPSVVFMFTVESAYFSSRVSFMIPEDHRDIYFSEYYNGKLEPPWRSRHLPGCVKSLHIFQKTTPGCHPNSPLCCLLADGVQLCRGHKGKEVVGMRFCHLQGPPPGTESIGEASTPMKLVCASPCMEMHKIS